MVYWEVQDVGTCTYLGSALDFEKTTLESQTSPWRQIGVRKGFETIVQEPHSLLCSPDTRILEVLRDVIEHTNKHVSIAYTDMALSFIDDAQAPLMAAWTNQGLVARMTVLSSSEREW